MKQVSSAEEPRIELLIIINASIFHGFGSWEGQIMWMVGLEAI